MNPALILRAILPAPLVAFVDRLGDRLRGLLQGETLRAIVYGAAVVIWLATRILQSLHIGHLEVVNLDVALTMATAAAALLTELARKYVYSPASVARIVATPPTAAGPISAAVDAGVPAEAVAQELATAGTDDALAHLDELADEEAAG